MNLTGENENSYFCDPKIDETLLKIMQNNSTPLVHPSDCIHKIYKNVILDKDTAYRIDPYQEYNQYQYIPKSTYSTETHYERVYQNDELNQIDGRGVNGDENAVNGDGCDEMEVDNAVIDSIMSTTYNNYFSYVNKPHLRKNDAFSPVNIGKETKKCKFCNTEIKNRKNPYYSTGYCSVPCFTYFIHNKCFYYKRYPNFMNILHKN